MLWSGWGRSHPVPGPQLSSLLEARPGRGQAEGEPSLVRKPSYPALSGPLPPVFEFQLRHAFFFHQLHELPDLVNLHSRSLSLLGNILVATRNRDLYAYTGFVGRPKDPGYASCAASTLPLPV